MLSRDRHLFVADPLEEMAEKTGMDSVGLLRIVKDYNQCCSKGYDDLFVKPHRYLRPIEAPKFCTGRHSPSAYSTLG